MKKLFLYAIAATAMLTSCSTSGLISKAKTLNFKESKPVIVTDIVADLEVSPERITFLYIPSKAVIKGGYNNVIETAIREALITNGNADVFVDIDKQVKVHDSGDVESVTISGYPAKYTNFRVVNEDYIYNLSKKFSEFDMGVDSTLKVVTPYLNISKGSTGGAKEGNPFIGKFK